MMFSNLFSIESMKKSGVRLLKFEFTIRQQHKGKPLFKLQRDTHEQQDAHLILISGGGLGPALVCESRLTDAHTARGSNIVQGEGQPCNASSLLMI